MSPSGFAQLGLKWVSRAALLVEGDIVVVLGNRPGRRQCFLSQRSLAAP